MGIKTTPNLSLISKLVEKNALTSIFKNIIWHLFTGQSQQVVKITVAYPVQRFFVVEAFTCQLEEVNTKCEWKG
jgi:hypothetical protein